MQEEHKRVIVKLDEPTIVRRKPLNHAIIDWTPRCFDHGQAEAMAFPAKLDGRKSKEAGEDVYAIVSWEELGVWYDDEPDFGRYAREIGGTIVEGTCED